MGSTHYIARCDELSAEQRAHRLAGYLWSPPERKKTPGLCQVCGHPLKVAYFACKPHENGQGIEQRVAAAPGTPQAEALAEKIGNGSAFAAFDATGWMTLPIMACDGLNEAVWAEAQKIIGQKRRERSQVAKPEAPQPEPAVRQPRQLGATSRALSLAELTSP